MQTITLMPISLVIPGGYWDTQLYSGELTLFRDDGALVRLHWRNLVDEVAAANTDLQTGLRVAFRDGDMFYNEAVRKILLDPQIAAPIKSQLNKAAGKEFTLGNQSVAKHSAVYESPIAFVPADTETYYNNLFVVGEDGLFSLHRTEDQYVSERHHESPATQVKASFDATSIATAAGDDGLFEFPILTKDTRRTPGRGQQISSQFCTACDWAFQSVVAWSSESAVLANFTDVFDRKTQQRIRSKAGVFELSKMFSMEDSERSDGSAIVWGSREKVYRLGQSFIDVLDYDHKAARKPAAKSEDSLSALARESGRTYFGSRGRVESGGETRPDDVVAVGTAPFGNIVELDDRLLVMRSDGITQEFKGEIVQWRVFPRSDHYSNQLHIIYEDRLEVVSFVHDYFVNQRNKLIGFSRPVREELRP